MVEVNLDVSPSMVNPLMEVVLVVPMLPIVPDVEVDGIELANGIERLLLGIESLQATDYEGKHCDLMASKQDV